MTRRPRLDCLAALFAVTGAVCTVPVRAQSPAYVTQIGETAIAAEEVVSSAAAARAGRSQDVPRGNVATIAQNGDANIATVIQQGGANGARLLQAGDDNIAALQQQNFIGRGANVMEVAQYGDRNRAQLTQTGADNRLDLTQTGDKDATISQSGSSSVSVAQLGVGPDSIGVTTDPGASVSVTRYAGLAAQGGR